MRKNKLDIEEFQSLKNFTTRKVVPFDTALEDFCEDRRRSGIRESTIEYYRKEINLLRRFIIREYDAVISVNEVTKETLDKFVEYLRDERGNGVGGINSKVRAVRAFFFYCEEVGYITNNPVEDWNELRRHEPEINAFTSKQVTALLKQADRRTFTGLRNYVLMLTLLDTGMRISEALGLTVDDLHFEDNRIYIRYAKNGLSRYVPMGTQLKQELRQYLRIHNNMSEYVFVNLQGKPIQRNSFRLIMHEYGKKAGIKGVRCSPHTFRHTFAKFYILNGGDAFSLMQILGHTDMDMVRRYIRLFSADVLNQHRKYSPMQNL